MLERTLEVTEHMLKLVEPPPKMETDDELRVTALPPTLHALQVQTRCTTSASPLHHLCIISASPLHHLCIISASPLHHLCITSASSLHHSSAATTHHFTTHYSHATICYWLLVTHLQAETQAAWQCFDEEWTPLLAEELLGGGAGDRDGGGGTEAVDSFVNWLSMPQSVAQLDYFCRHLSYAAERLANFVMKQQPSADLLPKPRDLYRFQLGEV